MQTTPWVEGEQPAVRWECLQIKCHLDVGGDLAELFQERALQAVQAGLPRASSTKANGKFEKKRRK